MSAVLDIERLSVALPVQGGAVTAVESVGLRIGAGETVCLVGESGSGKTVTALSILRLIDHHGGQLTQGQIWLDGQDIATLSQREMSELRGRRVGIVFQDPMTAFDPLFSIGDQIGEVIRRHRKVGRAEARAQTLAMLRRVRMPEPELRIGQHPHQLSGGMRQRAMIALALACGPRLLIADEPTTALDVTIQAQILTLLRELQSETGMAILLITHDLGVAAEMADRVVVMYAGRIVEDASVEALFARPAHPYTRGLLRSVVGASQSRGTRLPAIGGGIPSLRDPPPGCRFHPRCARATYRCETEAPTPLPHDSGTVACWHPHHDAVAAEAAPATRLVVQVTPETGRLVDVVDLHKSFPVGGRWGGGRRRSVRAVDGVSFHINAGETFGLVGESGCGKSTLARLLLGLETASSGKVIFDGEELSRLGRAGRHRARRHMQMIFQDPYGSIDPRWTVGDIIAEPLVAHGDLSPSARRSVVRTLLEQVGLDPAWETRYAHQLSGGQRQRIAIARAIAPRPKFVLADEAVSALDVSVQAQVINLLRDLGEKLGLTYLFIGHGLNLVRHVSDRIGVMYLGRLVEIGPAEELFAHPAHHYTKALLGAIPEPDPTRRRDFVAIVGELPSPSNPPPGCRFHTRCAAATARCREDDPPLATVAPGRVVACHFPL